MKRTPIRTDPEKLREWQRRSRKKSAESLQAKRGPGPKRRKGVNPVNRERRAERRERDFGPHAETIRALPCCVCGARPPSDPHHVRSRGAGGDASDLVPLCRACHDDLHRTGRRTFEQARGIDLRAIADRLWRTTGASGPQASEGDE